MVAEERLCFAVMASGYASDEANLHDERGEKELPRSIAVDHARLVYQRSRSGGDNLPNRRGSQVL